MLSLSDNRYSRITIEGVDDIYHFCIALLPVLCLLKVPAFNISLGTVLLIAFIPYSVFNILNGLKYGASNISALFFFVFYLYLCLRADGSLPHAVLCIATFIHLWGITCGAIDSEKLRKNIERYAIINSLLIVLQVMIYYGVHYKVQFLPQALFHEDFQNSYVFRETTGLYRPSALFLEPSHFSQYCCFALISTLFPKKEKINVKRAGLIALGCVLSTSGMGILMTGVIFCWRVFFSRAKKGTKLYKVIKWSPVVLIGLLILIQIPFIQTAFQRVFSNVDGYNAVHGRTGQWERAVGSMTGTTLWFGYGNNAKYPYYLAGLADTIYKYGIIGAFLEFACFLYLMFRKFDRYVWCCCVVFLALFCVAHLTSFYSQIFYFGLAVAESVATKNHSVISSSLGGYSIVRANQQF